MELHEKNEIKNLLDIYVTTRFTSQAKAAHSLDKVSEATVINIRTCKWEGVSDEMWMNVGKQLGFTRKDSWKMAETKDFHHLISFFEDAREYSNVFAITANSGSGKSFTAEFYASQNKNVYHIECAQYYNRKIFLGKLLQKMGKDNTGYNVNEMMEEIVDALRKQENPLIILDEADKLNDEVLYFFITLYNQLKGKCGIVIMATDHLEKKISRGRRLNKRGYAEIYSRIGRKFIKLPGTNKSEVQSICIANGLTDPNEITIIFNEYDGDLRRVERAVHKMKVLNKSKLSV